MTLIPYALRRRHVNPYLCHRPSAVRISVNFSPQSTVAVRGYSVAVLISAATKGDVHKVKKKDHPVCRVREAVRHVSPCNQRRVFRNNKNRCKRMICGKILPSNLEGPFEEGSDCRKMPPSGMDEKLRGFRLPLWSFAAFAILECYATYVGGQTATNVRFLMS